MKKKQEFENGKFLAAVQIVLTERSTSLITIFPQKNNGKEGLKLSKMRKKNLLAQIFRKDLTERKLERTRMKIMLSTYPSSAFSYKVQNIRFEKQICIVS